MTKKKSKTKLFLTAFLASLPLWLLINLGQARLESFCFSNYYQEPLFLKAQVIGNLEESKEVLPEIEAKAAISLKVDKDGKEEVIFEKNSRQSLPVASLTKLMTAWTVFQYREYYDLSRKVEVSEEAVLKEGDSGLKPGQIVSIEDLLQSMLIESSNDSAFALAESLTENSGFSSREKIAAFVNLMNIETEKNLGLRETYFVNPTGLEFSNGDILTNYSSARDMAEISKNIINSHPQIFEISRKESALIFGDYLAVNNNRILGKEILGGKTGWTPMAGGCIILIVKNGRGSYTINVILGADSLESRFIEMEKLIK
jgi:serine-type D-Ala-D-Ala carboxypeptidase (penicillin-binding protein 5/6)